MTNPPIVRIDNIGKRFGTGPLVLDGINLAVDRGEFISFIGPSGCGKSTLLRLIAGLTDASTGSLVVDGMTPVNAREQNLAEAVAAATDGWGADIVFEASGSPRAYEKIEALARPGGCVVAIGLPVESS